jgi:hypothetical protein
MINRSTACLLFLACGSLMSQVLSTPGDPVRAAEVQQRALRETTRRQEPELQARYEARQREFELRFNQLVNAVAEFARKYNDGSRATWPQHEADQLGKAMRELQSLEKSLRDHRGAAQDRRANAGQGR